MIDEEVVDNTDFPEPQDKKPKEGEKPSFELNPDDDIDTFIKRYSKHRGVPASVVRALRQQESSNGKNTHNKQTGAEGDFQYLPSTAKAGGIDADDPFQAAAATINSFADRYAKYRPQSENDDHAWQRVIASHYTGEGNVEKAIKAGKYLPETYNTESPDDPTTPEYVSQVWDAKKKLEEIDAKGAQVVNNPSAQVVNNPSASGGFDEAAFNQLSETEKQAYIDEQTKAADEATPLAKSSNPLTSGIPGRTAVDATGAPLGTATIHEDDPGMVYQQRADAMTNPKTELNKDKMFDSFLVEANKLYDKGRQTGDYTEYKTALSRQQFAPIQFVSQAQDPATQQHEIEQAVRQAAAQVSADPLETESMIAEMRAKGDGSIHIVNPETGEEAMPEFGKPFQVALSGEQTIRLRKHALKAAEDKQKELEDGVSPTSAFLSGVARSLSFNGLTNVAAGKVVSIVDNKAGKAIGEFGYDRTKGEYYGEGTRAEDYGLVPGTPSYNRAESRLKSGEMAGTIIGEISKLVAAHRAIAQVGKFLAPPVRALLSPMVDRFASIPGATSVTTAIGGEFAAQNALQESARLITERLAHAIVNSAAIAGINVLAPERVQVNFDKVNKSLNLERGIATTEIDPATGNMVFHKEGWNDVASRFSKDFGGLALLGGMVFPISGGVQVVLESPTVRNFLKPAFVGALAERGVSRLDAEVMLHNTLSNPALLNVLSSTVAGAMTSYMNNPDMDWWVRLVDIGSQTAQAYLTRAGSLINGKQSLGDFYVKHPETGQLFRATAAMGNGGVEFEPIKSAPKGSDVYEPVTKPELDLWAVMMTRQFGSPEQHAKMEQVMQDPAPLMQQPELPQGEQNVSRPDDVQRQPGEPTVGERPGSANATTGAANEKAGTVDGTGPGRGSDGGSSRGLVQSSEAGTVTDAKPATVSGDGKPVAGDVTETAKPADAVTDLDRMVAHRGGTFKLDEDLHQKWSEEEALYKDRRDRPNSRDAQQDGKYKKGLGMKWTATKDEIIKEQQKRAEPVEVNEDFKDRIVAYNGKAVSLTGEIVEKGQARYVKGKDKTGKDVLVPEDQAEKKNPFYRIQSIFGEETPTPEKQSLRDRVKLALTRYAVDKATKQFDVTDLGKARVTSDNTLYLDPVSSRDLSRATAKGAEAGVFEAEIPVSKIGAFTNDAAELRALADHTDNPFLKSALLDLKDGKAMVIDAYATERGLSKLHEGVHQYATPFKLSESALERVGDSPELSALREALQKNGANSHYSGADSWVLAQEALAFGLTGDSKTLGVDSGVLHKAATRVLRELAAEHPDINPEVLKRVALDSGKKIIQDFKNNTDEAPKAGFKNAHEYGRWKQGVIEETLERQPDAIAAVHENPEQFNQDYADAMPITERRALISDVRDIVKKPFVFAGATSKQVGDLNLYDVNKDGKGLFTKAGGDVAKLKSLVKSEGFDGYFIGNPDNPNFNSKVTPTDDSKVLQDKLKNMYHGTSSPDVFDIPKGKSWFTSDTDFASSYAAGEHIGGAEGPSRIYPASLSIENPFKVTDRLSQIELVNDPKRVSELEKQGYDGVVRVDEDGKVIALPFKDSQIKSKFDSSDAMKDFVTSKNFVVLKDSPELRQDLIRQGFEVHSGDGKVEGTASKMLVVPVTNHEDIDLVRTLGSKHKQYQAVVGKAGTFSAPLLDGNTEHFSKSGAVTYGDAAKALDTHVEINLPSGKVAFGVPDLFDTERSSRPTPNQQKLKEAVALEAQYSDVKGFSASIADSVTELPKSNGLIGALRTLDEVYAKRFPRGEGKISEPESITRFISDWTSSVRLMLDSDMKGKSWYSDDIHKMYETLNSEFPGIKDSETARLAFSTMLAVTSPRQDLMKNFDDAKSIFKRFITNLGKNLNTLPAHFEGAAFEGNPEYTTVTRGLVNLNKLYNGYVWDSSTGKMVFSETFRQDINKRGMAAVFDYLQTPGKSRVVVAQEMFGEKTGGLILALNGNTQIPAVGSMLAHAWRLNNGGLFNEKGELNESLSPALNDRIRGSIQSIAARLNSEGYKVTPVEVQAMIWTHMKSVTETMTGNKTVDNFDEAAKRSLKGAPQELTNFWKQYGESLNEANPEVGSAEYIRRAKAKSRILFRSDDEYARDLRDDVFYSQLEKTIQDKLPEKFPVHQLKSFLKNPKQGIKADEVEWSSVNDLLAAKADTDILAKQEVLDYVKQNRTKLYEFDSAAFKKAHQAQFEYDLAKAEYERYKSNASFSDSINDLKMQDAADRMAVFSKAADPHYTEMRNTPDMESIFAGKLDKGEIAQDFTTPGGDNYRAVLLKAGGIDTLQKHFFDWDSIAHARLTDRLLDGKNTLHVEELQSDHHQQGREQGYVTENGATTGNVEGRPVNEAPLKKTWHEAMFKRLMMEAANKGYQQLSWTSGDVHNERYGFSARIKSIVYDPERGQTSYMDLDGGTNKVGNLDFDELSTYFPPDVIESLRKDGETREQGDLWRWRGNSTYSEPQAKGMKAFYDGILTSYAKQQAKKFGSEVRETTLTDSLGNDHKVYAMDVTPQMGDRQPLFRTEKENSNKELLDMPVGSHIKSVDGIGFYNEGTGVIRATIQGDNGVPIAGAQIADIGGKWRVTGMQISDEAKAQGVGAHLMDSIRKQYPGAQMSVDSHEAVKDVAYQDQTLFRHNLPTDEDGWVESAAKLKGMSLTAAEEQHVRNHYQTNPDDSSMVLAVMPFKKSIPEFLLKVYKAGLLSGVGTTATNVLSNTAMIAMEEASKVPSAIMDIAISYASGTDRTALMPSPKAWFEGLKGVKNEGIPAFIDALKKGDFDNFYQIPAQSGIPVLDKTAGKLADYVFRFVSGQDKIFKAYVFRRTMYEQRVLEEKNGGRQRDDTTPDAAADLAQADLALRASAYATFQQDNFVAEKYTQAKGWAQNNMAPLSWFMDMNLPFVKTGSNVAMNAIDYMGVTGAGKAIHHAYSAINPSSWSQTKQEIAKIIDNPDTRREMLELSGRGMIGSALVLAGYRLAQAGLMTSDYDDKDKKQLGEMGERNAPFLGIKVGSRYVPFTRISPMGAFFAAGAKMYHHKDEGLNKNTADVFQLLVSQFPLGKFQEKISGDKLKATDLLMPTGSSLVPGIVRDVAKFGDKKRETTDRTSAVKTFINQIYASVPGLRSKLPVKTTALGYTMDEGDTVIGSTKARESKVVSELSRLNWFPSKWGTDPSGGYKERPIELRQQIRDSLEKIVNSKEYNAADDGLKANLLQKTTGVILDAYAKEHKDKELLERRQKKSEQTKKNKSLIREILGR
jgi:hypothetical protein